MNHPTALYRLRGARNQLLYIGISDDPPRRWAQHAADKTWWPNVVEQTVTWYPNRFEAEKAEAKAIHNEAPTHNKARPAPGNDLVGATRFVASIDKKISVAQVRRDASIVDALEEGWRVIDVMEVTGLSRERIRQIRNRVENDRARSELRRADEAGEPPAPF